MPGNALDVFISYSREDEVLRQELDAQLVRLNGDGLIGTWHDRRIDDDEAWRGEIDRELKSADLILLIVSAPFLESGYCQDAEIEHALELQHLGHAKVIPIIARPCEWRSAPFGKLATLPHGIRPLTEWHSRDAAWDDVSQAIRDVADQLITARLDSTAEYRIAVRRPIRKPEPPAPPPEEVAGAGTPRAMIAGIAAALLVLAAIPFSWWWSQRSEDGTLPLWTAEMRPLRTASGGDSLTAKTPKPVATTTERPATPPPPAARREDGPDAAATSPASPEEAPPADVETIPGEVLETPSSKPPEASTTETARPAAAALADDPPQERTPRQAGDFERSLGILATPGAESEGECLAVLVAGQVALTSSACAHESSVMVMGGNALTATRDEIFDLEPRPSAPANGVNVVRVLQGLDETWSVAATRFEESFDYPRLSASYVAMSQVRRVACVAVTRLTDSGRSGLAYVENAAFDRYVGLVEEAADEAISIAGAGWAEVLHEALDSAQESLDGFICDLPRRPPGNLVFTADGRVVGIGYPCQPFDLLEPEVRDHLPSEIRGLDLDCIASLGEIGEQLSQARSEPAP